MKLREENEDTLDRMFETLKEDIKANLDLLQIGALTLMDSDEIFDAVIERFKEVANKELNYIGENVVKKETME